METPPPAPDASPDPKPRRRGPPLVVLGGLGALVAGGAIAWALVAGDRGSAPPPPASEGGLVIDSSGAEDGRIDTGKPLRCFVQGQFVGELSLSDCARRNGVATDALDVGLDETGALAAAQEAGAQLVPLPPIEAGEPSAAEEPPSAETEEDQTAAAPTETCLRYGGGRWRRVGEAGDLNGCVQALFAGRCERPGGASYGRFATQTLRLVAGKVEVSDDNRSFRTLAPQAPDCSLPPVG